MNLKNIFVIATISVGILFAIISCKKDTPVTEAPEIEEVSTEVSTGLNLNVVELIDNAKAHPIDKDKILFINFWEHWCPPCNSEMPSIETLYTKYKENENIDFLIVSRGDVAANVKKSKNYNLPFYHLVGEPAAEFKTDGIPATFIVKNDTIVLKEVGARNWNDEKVIQFIDSLLIK